MEVSNKEPNGDARLDFRLNRQVKEVIERAAVVSGQSVGDFAVSALYRHGHRSVGERAGHPAL